MPFHDSISFDGLHKAKFDGGLDANRPANPEGFGDVYWATDANSGDGALYITNQAGDTWFEFTGGGGGAINLGDLADVDTTGVTNTQGLLYNSGAGEWQPQDIPRNLSDQLDVDITGLVDGQVLVWDNVGSQWVVATKVNALGDLSDVANFTQVKGDIMVSDGAEFDQLGVGSDGQTLIADSGETLGVRWGTSFDADVILTASGEVLVDGDGNVMTEPF